MTGLTHRLATHADLPALTALMTRAIEELQRPFLDPQTLEASKATMGLDTQLIEDRTYFLIEADGRPAGCGGWSARATLFGGDHSAGRDMRMLDPANESARVRAMYTHPDFTRRGVGRLVIGLCEDAARAAGFSSVVLVATLAGEPFYRACGYEQIERFDAPTPLGPVPLVRMLKRPENANYAAQPIVI